MAGGMVISRAGGGDLLGGGFRPGGGLRLGEVGSSVARSGEFLSRWRKMESVAEGAGLAGLVRWVRP